MSWFNQFYMKHAYMIIAHGNWNQLKLLMELLDDFDNDFFVHIDKKQKDIPIEDIQKFAKKSKVFIFSEYKVYWGSFELVKVELFLMRQASLNGYDYYHLLSGVDLPIKNLDSINSFFEANNGKEFIHYDTDDRLRNDKEIMRRIKYYHFFVNYRRRYNKFKFLNSLFTLLERVSLVFQMVFGVNRLKRTNYVFKYGSQWFSITDKLVRYILSKENDVYSLFRRTKCSDELFIQTLVYNSEFKDNLYNSFFNNSNMANLRLIDINVRGKNGSPYTWRIKDIDEIMNSGCLFARKFDPRIDNKIIEHIVLIIKK